MLHNALGEDTAAANCGENSCSEWQQKLLHAFSRTVPAAKPPLLKERGKAPAESKPLSFSISGFKVLLKLEIRPQPMPKQMNRIDR
jgi:hypothetical protein